MVTLQLQYVSSRFAGISKKSKINNTNIEYEAKKG